MELISQLSLSFNAKALLIIAFVIISTIAGQLAFRRLVGAKKIEELHDVAGHYVTIVSTIYAVTLGLIVFDAVQTFGEANLTVKNEARSLTAVYSLSERYPEPHRREIQNLVYNYVGAVIASEWNLMSGGQACPLSRKLMNDLLHEVNSIEPQTSSQLAMLPLLTTETLTAMDAAKIRLQKSESGIPDLEWFALLTGGFFTIFFTYFFVANPLLQTIMSVMVSCIIGTNLILVLAFGEPYSGAFKVSDGELVKVKNYIDSLR